MKNRLPNSPYNVSIETAERLNKLKKKGETQDGVVKRLLVEKEEVTSLRTDLDYMTFLRDDALKDVIYLRNLKGLLEIKLNESRQVERLIRAKPWTECIMLPWVF